MCNSILVHLQRTDNSVTQSFRNPVYLCSVLGLDVARLALHGAVLAAEVWVRGGAVEAGGVRLKKTNLNILTFNSNIDN